MINFIVGFVIGVVVEGNADKIQKTLKDWIVKLENLNKRLGK